MKINKREQASSISERNRALILTAAERAFAQNGFKGTSVKQIALDAGLPKTNVLYYFKTKQALYNALLTQIVDVWNSRFDRATAEDDPAETLAAYIAEKMEMSRINPYASKVFAIEIINGGINLSEDFLAQHRLWMEGRKAVIQGWIDNQKMRATCPEYLLFHIWACTQHYADFSSQISHLKNKTMTKKDFKLATQNLISLILIGCGLNVPEHFRGMEQ